MRPCNIASIVLFSVPLFALAVAGSFGEFAQDMVEMLRYMIVVIFGLAVVAFLIGVVRTIAGGNNENTRLEGRKLMLYGVIAIFVMVAFWGLVRVVTYSLFGVR
jgi:hypothetical protein